MEKTRSAQDKREYILHVTRKYEIYCGAGDRVQSAVARIRERFTPEECAKFGEMLSVISEELLPLVGRRPLPLPTSAGSRRRTTGPRS